MAELSLEEYHALVDAGVVGTVELLEGRPMMGEHEQIRVAGSPGDSDHPGGLIPGRLGRRLDFFRLVLAVGAGVLGGRRSWSRLDGRRLAPAGRV
jgi:hypothetical protein